MCDSFLQIFLTMLKWTRIHTHTNTHSHGNDAISKQVVRGDNQKLDSVSYSTGTMICHQLWGNTYWNFFIHSMLNRRWGLMSCDLKLGIMSSEKPTTCIIEENGVSLKYLETARLSGTRLSFKVSSATLRQEIENVVE